MVFPDIEFDRMKQIVQYLYTGKTLIPGNELVDFLNAAKKYEILGLCGEMDDMLSNGSIITAVRDRGAEKSFEINANENHCRNTANQIPEMTIPNVNADPKRSKRARIVLEHSDLPLAIATTSQETNALNKHGKQISNHCPLTKINFYSFLLLDENHPEENSNGGKSHSMDKVLKVEPGDLLYDENGDDGTLKKIKCMLCKRSFRYNVAFQKHLQCKGCAIEIDID